MKCLVHIQQLSCSKKHNNQQIIKQTSKLVVVVGGGVFWEMENESAHSIRMEVLLGIDCFPFRSSFYLHNVPISTQLVYLLVEHNHRLSVVSISVFLMLTFRSESLV